MLVCVRASNDAAAEHLAARVIRFAESMATVSMGHALRTVQKHATPS